MAASDALHAASFPTANSLPHSQRNRLLKSSRKIEAVLGATPLVLPVLDEAPYDIPAQPMPKLERSKSRSGKGVQPILLSRSRSLAAPSRSAPIAHIKSSSLDTAPTASVPPTPLSALFSPIPEEEESEAKEREVRRKKMAKITRTFGENVPPELVFGAGYQHRDERKIPIPTSPSRSHRSGRLSVSSDSSSNIILGTLPEPEEGELTPKAKVASFPQSNRIPFPSARDTPAATLTASTFYQHHSKAQSHTALRASPSLRRSRSQRTIAGYPVYLPDSTSSSQSAPAFDLLAPSPHHSTSPTASVQAYSPVKRAFTPSSTTVPSPPSPRNAFSLDVERPPPFTNFQDFAVQGRTPVDHVWGSWQQDGGDTPGRRKEKEWSGEWNVKDMGDVVKKLRELKGR